MCGRFIIVQHAWSWASWSEETNGQMNQRNQIQDIGLLNWHIGVSQLNINKHPRGHVEDEKRETRTARAITAPHRHFSHSSCPHDIAHPVVAFRVSSVLSLPVGAPGARATVAENVAEDLCWAPVGKESPALGANAVIVKAVVIWLIVVVARVVCDNWDDGDAMGVLLPLSICAMFGRSRKVCLEYYKIKSDFRKLKDQAVVIEATTPISKQHTSGKTSLKRDCVTFHSWLRAA